jgi:hypothetical protein
MANMIAEVIAEVEEVIGADKVVAVTTDNASAMKSAWAILRDICPGLMATGCTAHMVDYPAAQAPGICFSGSSRRRFARGTSASHSRYRPAEEILVSAHCSF